MLDESHASTDHTSPQVRCDAEAELIEGQLIARLPHEASAALPSRGQAAVVGTVNEQLFQTVVEPDGLRGHWIKLDPRYTSLVGITPGGTVRCELTPAEHWPEPDMPSDLQSALDAAPDISELRKAIKSMARWEWVRWICATRNPVTRARRVEVAVSKVRAGKRRPCCSDLAACTDPALARSGKLMASDVASNR